MAFFRVRVLVLLIVLLAAFVYRFPIEIQQFSRTMQSKIFESTLFHGEVDSDAEDLSELDINIIVVELNNGQSMSGVIKSENEKQITLDVGFGTISLLRSDIKLISTPDSDQKEKLLTQRTTFDKDSYSEQRIAQLRYKDSHRIVVPAVINGKKELKLILDTGAPYIVITPEAAQKFIDLDQMLSKKLTMEWGKEASTQGKLILLDSVRINDVEIKNVKAVVSKMPTLDPGTQGLLGMSFLRYFEVKIDSRQKKLTFEKK